MALELMKEQRMRSEVGNRKTRWGQAVAMDRAQMGKGEGSEERKGGGRGQGGGRKGGKKEEKEKQEAR